MKKFIRTAKGFTSYINDNEFVFKGNSYKKDKSGNYFMFIEPFKGCDMERIENGLIKLSITPEHYNNALAMCKEMLQGE